MSTLASRSTNIRFLNEPVAKVSWSEALDLFEYSTIVVECERPQNLAEFPDLPVRLRGALGRELYSYGGAIKHRPDPFHRLSPFDFLFGEHGFYKPNSTFPKPLVVRGYIKNDLFMVEIHLLGHAQYYVSQVIECMAQALECGISLSDQVQVRTPINIHNIWLDKTSRIQNPRQTASAVLKFSTPLCVRSGKNISISTGAFFNSLINRAEGLIRWLAIEVERTHSSFPDAQARVNLDSNDMHYISWLRHSIRQRGRSIPMAGFTGDLRLDGIIEPMIPALQICEIFGTGSHAGLGLGWYQMASYPRKIG